jgi:thiosulfate/3-mercaptopyruvate sulfurtransferase
MTSPITSLSTPNSSLPDRFVVSADWLAEHLSDPQVIVVDCRFSLMEPAVGQQQYEVSHIPGAFYLDLNQDLSSPVGQHGGRHPLPDPQQFVEKMTAIGVRSAEPGQTPTLVVAYDDSRFAYAARLWWLLRYLGHDQVAVLDGGFQAWKTAGYPTTAAKPQAIPGHFVPHLRSDWVVDAAAVNHLKDNATVTVVDSREGERYRGEREPIDPIAGHIPGAVNYPWQEVTDTDGFIRPLSAQQQRWQSLQNASTVLVYCGSGVTACVNLLSLAIAEVSNSKLYAGSWSDWCSHSMPVERSPDI